MPSEHKANVPAGSIPVDPDYAAKLRTLTARRSANQDMLNAAFTNFQASETESNSMQHDLWAELYQRYALDPNKAYAVSYDHADGSAPHLVEAEPPRSRDLALEVGRRFLRCRSEGWKAAIDYSRAITSHSRDKSPIKPEQPTPLSNPYPAARLLEHTAWADGFKSGAAWCGQGTETPLDQSEASLNSLYESLSRKQRVFAESREKEQNPPPRNVGGLIADVGGLIAAEANVERERRAVALAREIGAERGPAPDQAQADPPPMREDGG